MPGPKASLAAPLSCALLVASLILPGSAAAAPPDPDGARTCIDPARLTADAMAACLDDVRAAADARLNKTYNEALQSLGATDQAALRDAQRAWLAFRTKDQLSLNGPWRAQRNLAVRIDAAAADIAEINAREIALRVYLPS